MSAFNDRLAAMKQKQEAADVKKEAERAAAEKAEKVEKLGAEREAAHARFERTQKDAAEAQLAINEAEEFAESQGDDLDAEAKAEIDALKEEVKPVMEAFEEAKKRLEEIDKQLDQLGVQAEAAPARTVEAEVQAPTVVEVLTGEEPVAPSAEATVPGTTEEAPSALAEEAPAEQTAAAEAAPAEAEKFEVSPEESQKNLQKLKFDTINTTRGSFNLKDYYADTDGSGYSVENMIASDNKDVERITGLQTQLQAFENRDPNDLSDAEKTQLKSLLTSARGETYYSSGKPYDENGKTGMHVANEQIASLMGQVQSEIQEMRAQVDVLEGRETPARVGRVDLAKLKAGLEGVRPEDRQAWLEEQKKEIARNEEDLKKAEELIRKHNEEMKTDEPALRMAERTRHNAILEIDALQKKMRTRFASILENA